MDQHAINIQFLKFSMQCETIKPKFLRFQKFNWHYTGGTIKLKCTHFKHFLQLFLAICWRHVNNEWNLNPAALIRVTFPCIWLIFFSLPNYIPFVYSIIGNILWYTTLWFRRYKHYHPKVPFIVDDITSCHGEKHGQKMFKMSKIKLGCASCMMQPTSTTERRALAGIYNSSLVHFLLVENILTRKWNFSIQKNHRLKRYHLESAELGSKISENKDKVFCRISCSHSFLSFWLSVD